MTEDDKALVEQLEALAANSEGQDDWLVMSDAADRIEALSAENKRLREALEWYIAEDAKYMRAALGDMK